jgi:hypothetical protein
MLCVFVFFCILFVFGFEPGSNIRGGGIGSRTMISVRTACDGIDSAQKGVAYIAYTPQQCIVSKLICQFIPSSGQWCLLACIWGSSFRKLRHCTLLWSQRLRLAAPSYQTRPDMKPVDGVGGSGPEIRVGPDNRPFNVISGPKPRRQGGQTI